MRYLLFFIAFLFCNHSFSQSATASGTVIDTLNKENLASAVVGILRANDSVLVQFIRTDKAGNFQLNKLPAGKHLIMITYPGYADYYDDIVLSEGNNISVGKIAMTLKSKLLEDVTVRAKIAAIRLRGDTVEYKADSFKVSAGASVEEMLRKLPGLQVDKDGNITAQGTKVEKVLVDGEEFFGNDPTMATKNLQADAIDKVQVFDKKSDQAVFTGIDDGQKTKTLNLTLKDDKKKGYFGKLEMKGGPDDKWNNTAMLNSFKAKRRLTGYGIMSSTGNTGLNWKDRESYGGASNVEYNADEGYFYMYNSGDEFDNGNGSFSGEGIPKSWSTGINYSNKFANDKQNVNGSYRYNKLTNEGAGNTFTQSVLPNEVTLYTNESRSATNTRQRHSANGSYEWNIDSFTSVKINASGFSGNQTSATNYNSATSDNLFNTRNKNLRNIFSDKDESSFNSNFIFRRRFKKAGRTISLSFDEKYKKNNSAGFLFSIAEFYDKSNALTRTDTTDQNKINYSDVLAYNTRLALTEQLFKKTFIELSYGLRLTESESKKLSYLKNAAGKYEVLDALFSNHFNFSVLTNTVGSVLRYNGKKFGASGGGDIGISNFKQLDLMKDTLRKYNFTNLFPRGSLQYKFDANTRLGLDYNGSTRQPTIDQIQPVRDNSNNLNVVIGNPSIKQEFRHTFNLNYNSYKILSQRGLYSYASFTTISNSISTKEQTSVHPDSTGFRSFQYINVNGNYSGYLGGGYSMKLKKPDLNINTNLYINVDHINTVINNIQNTSDNVGYELSVGLYKYKDKKYSLSYNSGIKYNTSKSSVNTLAKTNYFTTEHRLDVNVTLLKKFEFNSSINGDFRQRLTAADVNNNVVIWNAYVGRKILKNDKASIRLEAYDILNQNKGFSRYLSANQTRENTYQTLRRYFLLGFIWNFSKTPAGMAAPQ